LRMAWLRASATKTSPLASIATPEGYINDAPVPVPSANPNESLPASVVTTCARAQPPNAAASRAARSSQAPPFAGARGDAERAAHIIAAPSSSGKKHRAPQSRRKVADEVVPPFAPARPSSVAREEGPGVKQATVPSCALLRKGVGVPAEMARPQLCRRPAAGAAQWWPPGAGAVAGAPRIARHGEPAETPPSAESSSSSGSNMGAGV
jgi:hypothetical protein